MTRRVVGLLAAEHRHLDERGQKPRPLGEVDGFEQRLLLARAERAGHGEHRDEALIMRAFERLPIAGDAEALEKGLERRQQPRTVDEPAGAWSKSPRKGCQSAV